MVIPSLFFFSILLPLLPLSNGECTRGAKLKVRCCDTQCFLRFSVQERKQRRPAQELMGLSQITSLTRGVLDFHSNRAAKRRGVAWSGQTLLVPL